MTTKISQEELIIRIASVVGHELRNPLAVIGNSSYFVKTALAGSKLPNPKIERHLGIIASEIARADRLIADMLFFSRPLELQSTPTDLSMIVEEALSLATIPPGVKVKREKPKTEIAVHADMKVLGDALRRVVDNAVEAMSGSGSLTISWGARGGAPFVEVRDSGTGIQEEALPVIFEPFFTTKPRGLGLGLAVARKAAAVHKGAIEAKNLPGNGAVVTLTLPKS